MEKIDHDGLLLCEIQAKTFELSVSVTETSSEIFVRRFMNSKTAKRLDEATILWGNDQPMDLLRSLDREYGQSNYGSVKYSPEEMYWIGYIYRYFAYTYGKTSVQVYRLIKPKELRELYLPYHTMDPAQAIDRILEAKGIDNHSDASEEVRQFDIFKRIRNI